MKIKCPNCNTEFSFSNEQEIFIQESKKKGLTFAMLRCSICDKSFPINPTAVNIEIETEESLRCPISGCSGFVSYIDDSDDQFYGCGECGAIWYNKSNLFTEIANIINTFPYRGKVYILKGDMEFTPIAIENSPKEYEQLVEKEPKENMKSFIRG